MALKHLALGASLALLASSAFAQTPVVNPDADKEDWLVLFNGKDLKGWTPKLAKHELGDNFGNTFRRRWPAQGPLRQVQGLRWPVRTPLL